MPFLLVAKANEEYPQHYVVMPYLLAGQDRGTETKWFITVIATAKVKVGLHHMRLCHASTPFSTLDGCSMG